MTYTIEISCSQVIVVNHRDDRVSIIDFKPNERPLIRLTEDHQLKVMVVPSMHMGAPQRFVHHEPSMTDFGLEAHWKRENLKSGNPHPHGNKPTPITPPSGPDPTAQPHPVT